MINKANLNHRVYEAVKDSGWRLFIKAGMKITWKRTIELRSDGSVEDVIRYLNKCRDFPGSSGIDYKVTGRKQNVLILTSTEGG